MNNLKIVKPGEPININDTPDLLVSGKHASEEQRFEALKDAYNNKQLTFTRAKKYLYTQPDTKKVTSKKPQPGNIWYLIHLTSNEEDIYNGAFELPVELENKLKAKDKLIPYLTFQLLTQI